MIKNRHELTPYWFLKFDEDYYYTIILSNSQFVQTYKVRSRQALMDSITKLKYLADKLKCRIRLTVNPASVMESAIAISDSITRTIAHHNLIVTEDLWYTNAQYEHRLDVIVSTDPRIKNIIIGKIYCEIPMINGAIQYVVDKQPEYFNQKLALYNIKDINIDPLGNVIIYDSGSI